MKNYNPYDELYSQFNMGKNPFGYSLDYFYWRESELKSEISKYITERGKVLDGDGGTGILYQFISDTISQKDYFNLDHSFEMLKYSPYTNIQSPAENLPFKSEVSDYVVCSEVLEHVNDKIKVLNECYRVLKDSGFFLLTTPRTGWVEDYKRSPFIIFLFFQEIKFKIKELIPKRIKNLIKKTLKRNNPSLIKPEGFRDIPSDEAWMKKTLEKIGFKIIEQYRIDNHFPFAKN